MNRKEFYESLSEETKAKIKACKSEQEMLKVLAEERIELDPDLLGSVSGGNDSLGRFEECKEKKCDDDGCL